MNIDQKFLKLLRTVGIIEGCSTLLLFCVAMPLKYYFDLPLAVRIVGSAHGLLFLALVAMFIIALDRIPISKGLALAGILGAVIPLGPFVVDHYLKKVEHSAKAS